MPFTYFAHQTVVLPLKWARPRWFDGCALCIGSMAPDFAYAFDDTPLAFRSHNLAAQFSFSLPFALLTARLFRAHLAEPIGAQLPGALGAELRALVHTRHSVWISAASALIGGLSHLFLDGFTHAHGWAVMHSASLRAVVATVAGFDIPAYAALQYLGHSLGSLLGLWLAAKLVRERFVSRWNRVAPLPATEDAGVLLRFYRATTASAGFGILAAATGTNMPIAIIRGSLTFFAGVALAALVAQRQAWSTRPGRREDALR